MSNHDHLLCSEDDMAHLKPSEPIGICESLDEIDRILGDAATDPFEFSEEANMMLLGELP